MLHALGKRIVGTLCHRDSVHKIVVSSLPRNGFLRILAQQLAATQQTHKHAVKLVLVFGESINRCIVGFFWNQMEISRGTQVSQAYVLSLF